MKKTTKKAEQKKFQWNVGADFCGSGSSCGMGGISYLLFPKLRVETSRRMTEDERREVEDAIVKAAAEKLARIAEGAER